MNIKQWTLSCLLFSFAVFSVNAQAAEEALGSQASFEAGFSPRGSSLQIVLKGIKEAQLSVHVAAYVLTSKPISTALVQAFKRGVDVKVVADEDENTKSYSAATFLANEGVSVRLNGHYAIHHHKFMVIDGEHLELGSFNYTAAAANKNAENVLYLRHVKPLAEVYDAEWQRLWDESDVLEKAY